MGERAGRIQVSHITYSYKKGNIYIYEKSNIHKKGDFCRRTK